MIRSFVSALFLATTTVAVHAQTTPSSTDQICSLLVRDALGAHQSLQLDYGQKSKIAPSADNELAQEASEVGAMDSSVQALAYLVQHGWQVMGFVTVGYYEHFYFHRAKK